MLRPYKLPADLFVLGSCLHTLLQIIHRPQMFFPGIINNSKCNASFQCIYQFAPAVCNVLSRLVKTCIAFLPSVNGTTTFSICAALCFADIFKYRNGCFHQFFFTCADNCSIASLYNFSASCVEFSFSNSSSCD